MLCIMLMIQLVGFGIPDEPFFVLQHFFVVLHGLSSVCCCNSLIYMV